MGRTPPLQRPIRWILRFPFTAALIVVLFVAAWATGSIVGRLTPDRLAQLGFAPEQLWTRQGYRMLTSIVFTWGGLSFWGVVLLVALCLGLAEARLGSRRAGVLFLTTHVGALVLESLAITLPLLWLHVPWAAGLARAADAGPSAGCFGCLGALVATLPPRRSLQAAAALALASLLVVLWREDPGLSPMTLVVSDLSHPIAALWGYLQVRLGRRAPGTR